MSVVECHFTTEERERERERERAIKVWRGPPHRGTALNFFVALITPTFYNFVAEKVSKLPLGNDRARMYYLITLGTYENSPFFVFP